MQLTAAMQMKRATIAQIINHSDVESILLVNETKLQMCQKRLEFKLDLSPT